MMATFFDGFQKFCCFFVLAKCCVDKHQVLDSVWISLVLRFDVHHEVLTLAMLAQLHQTVGFDRVVERILLLLQ